jgi:hypothetical protein
MRLRQNEGATGIAEKGRSQVAVNSSLEKEYLRLLEEHEYKPPPLWLAEEEGGSCPRRSRLAAYPHALLFRVRKCFPLNGLSLGLPGMPGSLYVTRPRLLSRQSHPILTNISNWCSLITIVARARCVARSVSERPFMGLSLNILEAWRISSPRGSAPGILRNRLRCVT